MSEIIILEKFKAQDFELFYGLVNDERVMALITERTMTLEDARRDFAARIENSNQHPSFGFYKVFEKDTKQFIGAGKLTIENRDLKEAELGYMLLPQFWGNGYGNEITEVLLQKARKESTLKKITAVIHSANIASRKILVRNGFKVNELQKKDFSEFYDLNLEDLNWIK